MKFLNLGQVRVSQNEEDEIHGNGPFIGVKFRFDQGNGGSGTLGAVWNA